MADDAGALLVRSGLVSSSALDDARARVASLGGTLGEQLVTGGSITDDALTDFYRSRLLVPQVNPNLLARLLPRVVNLLPGDMAIELRAIPVSLDADNNLTVAMSDPSDRHAVDEIGFFTGTYVVRAVATQMQIAWCLAHYYGHVTPLGQRLLHTSDRGSPLKAAIAAVARPPRTKGLTGKVNATRHRAVAPITGPVNVVRPTSGELDLRPLASHAGASHAGASHAGASPGPSSAPPSPATGMATSSALGSPILAPPAPPVMPPSAPLGPPRSSPSASPPPPSSTLPGTPAPPPGDAVPDRSRTRSVSGEIRVPQRRAPSIRPPLPEPDDDDEPVIVIERDAEDDATGRVVPPRRRAVKSDPPELYARAGEVDLKAATDRTIADEPRIVIDEDALAPPTGRTEIPGAVDDDAPVTGPITAQIAAPITAIDVIDDAGSGAVIHDRIVERESQPILLDRPRPTPDPLQVAAPTTERVERVDLDDADTGETDIVMLEARKKPRAERHTVVGVPPAPVPMRPHHEPEAIAIPALISASDDSEPTKRDLRAAPGDDTTSDQLAAPPSPASEYDTNPHVIAPPPPPSPSPPAALPRASALRPAMLVHDAGDDEDDEDDADESDDPPRGRRTSEMSAAELDDAIPERTTEFDLSQLPRRRIDYDPVDDGWGPPGTTIPPPLLGAIPGSDDDDDDEPTHSIPMHDVDSSPLMVGPPPSGEAGGRSLAQTLEQATARAIEVIRQLERANSRDEVINLMTAYLAETHHRAGFFATRHTGSKGVAELGVFAMMPRPAVLPFATLRLDRPSTLEDVVGTRLPYRGPMHDDASRGFLIAVLGACPPEILLVPVAVRERVVGVLFGEHRKRHTLDDQLALAARAAGMALERILRARRP